MLSVITLNNVKVKIEMTEIGKLEGSWGKGTNTFILLIKGVEILLLTSKKYDSKNITYKANQVEEL